MGARLVSDLSAFRTLPAAALVSCEKRVAQVVPTSLVRYRCKDHSVPTPFGMLPAAGWAQSRLGDPARVTEIDLDDGAISVEGHSADGMRIAMEFGRNGVLHAFERERDGRRSLSDASARAWQVALGHTVIGFIERGWRHFDVAVINPGGDRRDATPPTGPGRARKTVGALTAQGDSRRVVWRHISDIHEIWKKRSPPDSRPSAIPNGWRCSGC
jgi:hypothetical protein